MAVVGRCCVWVLTAATAHLGALGRVVDLGGKVVVGDADSTRQARGDTDGLPIRGGSPVFPGEYHSASR